MTKALLILIVLASQSLACSAFVLSGDNRHVVGKNYDWHLEDGRIILNGKNLSKSSFGTQRPITWVSKFGSVTFNQYGMEFPCGGMNEKGLVVEALWLQQTSYPPNTDNKDEIDNMQWIQYQLDCSATIEDVVASDKNLAIHPIAATAVHYFVADKNGNSLIFESVNGVMRHYFPDASSPALLTNDPYDKSLRQMKKCKAFGGTLDQPEGQGSISRFIQMAVLVKGGIEANPVEQSFAILCKVRMSALTKWSIVYDQDSLVVHFRTASRHAIRKIDLSRLAFSCSPTRKAIDVKLKKSGDIAPYFEDYDLDANSKLITLSFDKTDFLKSRQRDLVSAVQTYLGSIVCAQPGDIKEP